MLLVESQDRVQQYDRDDDARILEVADERREHRCGNQHDDQEAPELIEELEPCRARWLLPQRIASEDPPTLIDIELSETAI